MCRSPRTYSLAESRPPTVPILPLFREAVVDIDKDVKVNVKGLPGLQRRPARDTRPPTPSEESLRQHDPRQKARPKQRSPSPNRSRSKSLARCSSSTAAKREARSRCSFTPSSPCPPPTPTVTTVTIHAEGQRNPCSRENPGHRRLQRLPARASTSSSGRPTRTRAKKVGYLEARCPDGVFKVNFPELLFENEAHTPGVEATTSMTGRQAVPCTPVS